MDAVAYVSPLTLTYGQDLMSHAVADSRLLNPCQDLMAPLSVCTVSLVAPLLMHRRSWQLGY